MSAGATAARVLDWAAGGAGAPPVGDLKDPLALLRPSAELAQSMGRLCALTGARLRWGDPPLGDGRPLGVGGALLAAALGAAPEDQEDAATLLDAVPPARTPAEWALRHGLIAAALPFLPTTAPAAPSPEGPDGAPAAAGPHAPEPARPARFLIADDWLRLSPLTALLGAPREDQRAALTGLAADLIARRAGRRWLVLTLAEPAQEAAIQSAPGALGGRRGIQGRTDIGGSGVRDPGCPAGRGAGPGHG